MGILYAPETDEAKLRVKWEAQGSEMGPGQRPYVYRPYPAMIYRAGRPDNGLGPHTIVEQITVDSAEEAKSYESSGFRATPLDAIAYVDAQQLEFSKLAAEINAEQKHKLSPNASAEVEQARAAHVGEMSGHMPSVPVTPIAPRRKNQE